MSLVKAPEPNGYLIYGPEPKFPDVPYSEWKARIDKLKKLMRENSVDLLMVADDPNCRYFTGITSEHWITRSIQPLLALIPVDGEPVVITGDLFRMTMEAQSWVRDIRCQEKPHEIQAHRGLWKEVAETIKDMGYGKSNIGIENGPLGHVLIPRPLIDIQTFIKELPEARIVDGDRVIWGCRMIKSPLEIERLKQASAVQRKGYLRVVEEYRPGMTETDIGKILWHSYLDSGADKLIAGHIACGAEKEGMLDTGFHFDGAEIHRDDYLWLDMAVRCKGYWSDNARVLNVGPLPDWFMTNNEVLWKAFDAAAEVARPGIPAKEIWKAATAVETEVGWPPLEMVGHGIGMDIHEPPALSAEAETILEPGMCFEVEPASLTGFRKFGGQGIFHYENLVIITERGCEVVHGLRRGIIQVNHPFQ